MALPLRYLRIIIKAKNDKIFIQCISDFFDLDFSDYSR